MSVAGLFTVILFLALPVTLALTLIVNFIYKFFYNKHLNKAIKSEQKLSKWISPLAVVVITIVCCVLVIFGLSASFYLLSADYNSGSSTRSQAVLEIKEKNGEYEVKSNTGYLLQKEFDLEGLTITSYNNENELFAVFNISDPETVEYFKVYEGDEVTKVEYKDEDDKFMNPFPMYLDIQEEGEPIRIEVYSETGSEPIGEAILH